MNLTQTANISDEAITQEVRGELVILDLRSEQYFSLDEVGARAWQLLVRGHSVAAVIGALVEEYDVDTQILEADIVELIGALQTAGLITLEQSSE